MESSAKTPSDTIAIDARPDLRPTSNIPRRPRAVFRDRSRSTPRPKHLCLSRPSPATPSHPRSARVSAAPFEGRASTCAHPGWLGEIQRSLPESARLQYRPLCLHLGLRKKTRRASPEMHSPKHSRLKEYPAREPLERRPRTSAFAAVL